MDDLQQHAHHQAVKRLIQEAIVCPVTGLPLDIRSCVVTLGPDGFPKRVLSQEGWAEVSDPLKRRLAELGETVDEVTVAR